MRRCIYLILVLASLSACQNTKTPNPLATLLFGQIPLAIPIFSKAGSSNNGAAMEGMLISTIALSSKTVSCVFEDVGLPGVIRALQFAKGRGAEVRVSIDADHKDGIGYRQLSTFMNNSGEDRNLWAGNSGVGKVGLNTCVSDGSRVFLSSAPPTIQGLYSETAFSIYLQDDENEIPAKFTAETDLMTHGSFGSGKQKLNRRNFYTLGGTGIGIYMAPADHPLEGFLVSRVAAATNSIQVYSSEWFSNELDTALVRETNDLAFEIKNSAAPSKQFVGTLYAATSTDPSAFGGLNSLNYLSNNGLGYRIKAGEWGDSALNIIVLDVMSAKPKLYVTSFGLGTRSDTAHDGFLMEFEDRYFVDAFANFFNEIQAEAVVSVSPNGEDQTTSNSMDVVISELNWMGGYDDAGTSTTTEYVELYNNTNRVINISNWVIECGAGGAFATLVATLPAPSVIAPGQYFVVAQNSTALVESFHRTGITGSNRMNDSTTEQCRLTESVANGGTTVDVAGLSGTTFASNSNSLGQNDTSSKIRRSMERTVLNSSGNNTTNWHTNSHTDPLQNANIAVIRINKTFGTPGYANSAAVPPPASPPAAASCATTDVKITEYISNPTGVDTNGDQTINTGDDEFVEIKNISAVSCSVANWVITDGALPGTVRFTFPSPTDLAAGQRAVVWGGGTPAAIPGALTFTTGSLSLNNGADTINLCTSSGCAVVVDALTYASETPGVSRARNPEDSGGFVDHTTPAPNEPYSVGTAPGSAYPRVHTMTGHSAPFSGQTGVSLASTVVVRFNMNMNAATLNNSNIKLFANSDCSSSEATLNLTGTTATTATFTPVSTLTASTTYCVSVSTGVSSANGIAQPASTTYLFTTIAPAAPTYTSSPASGATSAALAANIVLTFSEAMNNAVGTVTIVGSTSGTKTPNTCTWTTVTFTDDTCTINPTVDFSAGETVTVTLSGIVDSNDGLAPATTVYTFTAVDPANAPTVTNVVVASTVPNNGTVPYNTGTSTLTITGTNFTYSSGVSCPSGVILDDVDGAGTAVNTVATSCTVDSATQITATFPNGIKTNGATGWNVKVTNPAGQNATSSVKFIPKAGLLISEVIQNGAAGAGAEMIEIYNPTSLPIDLVSVDGAGLTVKLHTRSSTGVGTNKTLTVINGATRGDGGCVTNDTTIPSHGFYIMSTTTVDTWFAKRNMTYAAGLTGTGGVELSLSTTTDVRILDKVGWVGGTGNFEGTAVAALGGSQSIERKPAGGGGHATDTDVNLNDFNAASGTYTARYCLDAAQP